ncbi:hypothetical protein PENVUL_c008G01825 [Penicillium vulpinum]|uniref:Uncharacterized protein n=1 Tax=Penicillium vulpinum TaxID=29845 RepID=A0A1V6S4F5_9EURO|nr:hypothetical protein PENVUL_c008G01825 [Penicillium vulpinum]
MPGTLAKDRSNRGNVYIELFYRSRCGKRDGTEYDEGANKWRNIIAPPQPF